MTDIKNYLTGDPVHDHSELSLQISNGIIILFPMIALSCQKRAQLQQQGVRR